MDQTQAFLERVLPWSEYPHAYRNIHSKRPPKADGSSDMSGQACRTIEEALNSVSYQSKKFIDVFVCMSLQTAAHDRKQTINGYTPLPGAKRSKASTLGSKCFYLDIDVKPNAYPTTADALRALSVFVTSRNLPKPTTITASGGGGIHVIWVMEKFFQPAEWQVIARSLATAASQAGLAHDANVATDITRLLRIPGTFNSKYSPMTLCHTLGKINAHDVPEVAFKESLADILPSNVVQFESRAPLSKQSEFSAGITLQSKPVEMDALAAACPMIATTLADHGAYHSGGGIWPLVILMSTFVEDGRAWAHELSRGHPEYTPAATDAKFDEKVAARKASNDAIGWPSCATLHNAFPSGACNTCPHRQAGKTPFHFTDATSPQSVSLPPAFYQNGGGVRFNYEVEGKDGQKVQRNVSVCAYEVADPWLDKSPEGSAQLNFKFFLGGKPAGNAVVPADKVTAQTISPLMARQDMFLDPTEVKPFMGFVMSWIKQLQNASGNGVITPALGWVGDGDMPKGFAYDNVTFTPNGPERASRSDTAMLSAWQPVGSLDKWKETAKFIIDQQRPALDAILAASFAGPLVKFTGHRGLLGSAYSPETGIGKTTAMSIAAAVWGHPTDSAQALDDTPLSSLKRLGAIHSLPFFWDEVRLSSQDKTDKLATLIFALTTGRERTRLNANTTMQVSGKWQTMMVTASNQSILEIAREATRGSDAGGVRVFEWRVPPAPQVITSSEASRIAAAALSNYGQAGRVYAEWLGKNHVQAQHIVATLNDMLNKECNAVPDERFWIASMAVLLAGAAIARKLNLVDFSLQQLKMFCVDTLTSLRLDRSTTPSIGADSPLRIAEMLGAYLAETKYDRTLETSPGKQGFPVQIEPGAERLRALDVHVDNAAGLIHLRTDTFYDWLRSRGLQRKSVLEGLRLNIGAAEQRVVMGAGTSHSTRGKVSAVTIPIKSLTGTI